MNKRYEQRTPLFSSNYRFGTSLLTYLCHGLHNIAVPVSDMDQGAGESADGEIKSEVGGERER